MVEKLYHILLRAANPNDSKIYICTGININFSGPIWYLYPKQLGVNIISCRQAAGYISRLGQLKQIHIKIRPVISSAVGCHQIKYYQQKVDAIPVDRITAVLGQHFRVSNYEKN